MAQSLRSATNYSTRRGAIVHCSNREFLPGRMKPRFGAVLARLRSGSGTVQIATNGVIAEVFAFATSLSRWAAPATHGGLEVPAPANLNSPPLFERDHRTC